MIAKDSNFLERIDLYIWWVKNYSQKVLPSKIKEEAEPLIEELETVKKTTGINYSSLVFLYELRFFNFDILKVEEYERNKINWIAYYLS